MKFQAPNINWFDVFVMIVLLIGYIRGRKRGMSEELLDVFQWLVMVVAAGLIYKPIGQFATQYTGWALIYTYVLSYLLLLLVVKVVFVIIKRSSGEKLVGSDLFGRLEYPLGILAGMVRFSCMFIVLLALINARQISDAEYEKAVKESTELYGDNYFQVFSLGAYQRAIFRDSFVGPHLKKHLDPYLIKPSPYVDIMQKREGFGRKQEREIDELLGGPKKK